MKFWRVNEMVDDLRYRGNNISICRKKRKDQRVNAVGGVSARQGVQFISFSHNSDNHADEGKNWAIVATGHLIPIFEE